MAARALLVSAALAANPAAAQPVEADADRPLSRAQTELFRTPHLANVRQPSALLYDFTRHGPVGFTDRVTVQVRAARADGTRDVAFDEEEGRAGLRDAVRFLDHLAELDDPLLTGVLLPCRIETLTEELLGETARIGRERGVLIRLHALQGLVERDIMQFNNLRDPKSGMTWYEAASILAQWRFADTPFSRLLADARRQAWAAAGEPPRPDPTADDLLVDHGGFRTEPTECIRGGPPADRDAQQRAYDERHARDAAMQIECEARARRDHEARRGRKTE